MNCSAPGSPVLHHPPKFIILMSIELVMPSNHLILCHPPYLHALNLSQHQGLFQQVGSSHHVAKVLELQPFQEIFRVDLQSHHTTPVPGVLSWVSTPGMTTWFKDQKQEVPKEVSEGWDSCQPQAATAPQLCRGQSLMTAWPPAPSGLWRPENGSSAAPNKKRLWLLERQLLETVGHWTSTERVISPSRRWW